MHKLFKQTAKPAVVKEDAGVVRLTLIEPDQGPTRGGLRTRTFPYQRSVAIMHPDQESEWFLFILDEGQDAAYTFGVHQDRVFTMELIEGDYKADDHRVRGLPDLALDE